MKKYFITFIIALIIGFFLAVFFITQYKDYKGIKVSSNGEILYFIQYGVYSSIESMEENTIELQNYIYNIENEQYHVYVGITKVEKNKEKILNYYKNQGYELIIKEFQINSREFLNVLNTYDSTLENIEDETAIASLINQVLNKYEEVVNDNKN